MTADDPTYGKRPSTREIRGMAEQERDQQPRPILMFTLASVVITVATTLLIFLSRSEDWQKLSKIGHLRWRRMRWKTGRRNGKGQQNG